MKPYIKNSRKQTYGKVLNFDLIFSQNSMYSYFLFEFSLILLDMLFSLAQFPSSCTISDETDKMPRNESKNKISLVI